MNRNVSVRAEKLTRKFGKFVAVDNISFEVYNGEIFGFLGANGAGKTTTFRMLCGLLMPTSGSGRVEEYDIYTQSEEIKRIIGYMSQKFSLYNDLTVFENIDFFGGIYGLKKEELKEAIEYALTRFRLNDHRNRLTRDIPIGWQQRLALCCSILHHPKILFLDEPTGGVDPISRREFWKTIHELSDQGTTIFVTTHYMDEAEYCHRLSIMHNSKIVEIGKPRELKRKYKKNTIQEVFLEIVNHNNPEMI
jgi:ABC-2 type transport system ATP-binding protein